MELDAWLDGGEHVEIDVAGHARSVFVRRWGSGPPMTLVHGFPSSSYEWRHVARELSQERSLLIPDLLGFGASEKPRGHRYSIVEQADVVEALWERSGVTSTVLVAHDYGASVAQELLARHVEGVLGTDLVAVHLLNGGIYPDLHRPRPLQTALADPVDGPRLARELDAAKLTAAVRSLVGTDFDPSEEAAAMWRALSRDDGHHLLHELSHYLRDREVHAARWVGALEHSDVPIAFTWGMADPNSGAHVADRIRERLPHAPLTTLDDVGHWPHLEVPGACSRSIADAIRT